MEDDVKTALRLTEKINDRHELAIESARQDINRIKVKCAEFDSKVSAIQREQKDARETQKKLDDAVKEINALKAKLIGAGSAVLGVYEFIKWKLGGG